MKRFAVLCSVVAVFSLYAPSTWATAPAVSDLPDVRVLTGGGGPPKGVISSGLNQVEMDAYNLDAFIKDFDDSVGGLTKSISGTTLVDPPPSQAPNAGSPLPVIELDAGNNVDVYGLAAAGWARYTANVDDGTNPVTQRTAIAKYSTFAMGTPSLSEGRFFNLSGSGWQFAYVWTGSDITLSDLQGTISPATSVNWAAYMNDVDYQFDANGNLLGLDPKYVAHGASFTAKGWNVSISSTGGLVVAPGASFSPGPYLIGILAINQADPNDIDATRVMVAEGLLGLATPGESTPPTREKSETLDGLTPGAVAAPTGVTADMTTPIQAGSMWCYRFIGTDEANVAAPMEIVNLAGDAQLPAAAAAQLGSQMIAGGNGLKATLAPTAALPYRAFRLLGRAVQGAQPGEVYTFSVNIATDVQNATDQPVILMALASGLGTMNGGFYMDKVAAPGVFPGTLLDAYQKDIIPFAADGWQTLSVNYTPPLTTTWLDANSDGQMNQTDLDLIAGVFGPTEGWTNELTVIRSALKMESKDADATVHVWMDNFRVFKSAYELDLGLEVTEYAVPADLTGVMPSPDVVPAQPSGNIDGSFESYAGDLGAIGFVKDRGEGAAEDWRKPPFGPYPVDTAYVDAGAGAITVNTSVDHTKSAGSSKCLQIALPGTGDAAYRCYRSWVDTAIVALPGEGIYGVEAFVSKQRATNSLATDRTPSYIVALNQIAPNPAGPAYGVYMNAGGVPISVGEEDNNWIRVVGTAYLSTGSKGTMARGVIQITESFDALSSAFTVPSYVDDYRVYRVDDPAKFFDADLFDSI